jgi:hypothetical protein
LYRVRWGAAFNQSEDWTTSDDDVTFQGSRFNFRRRKWFHHVPSAKESINSEFYKEVPNFLFLEFFNIAILYAKTKILIRPNFYGQTVKYFLFCFQYKNIRPFYTILPNYIKVVQKKVHKIGDKKWRTINGTVCISWLVNWKNGLPQSQYRPDEDDSYTRT